MVAVACWPHDLNIMNGLMSGGLDKIADAMPWAGASDTSATAQAAVVKGGTLVFIRITNPSITVFDGKTEQLVGVARFTLAKESEQALLALVNEGRHPQSLMLLNVDFYQPTEHYHPPHEFIPVKSKGILRGAYTTERRELSVIEIRFSFDAIARGKRYENRYFFDSVEYNNIKIDSISEVIY
ncbi:MAG: hypothetical protein H6Q60_450 [Oscillospiraceae bacterium]|nr:hypothetical protein [Oscillospiraceae bacterium]